MRKYLSLILALIFLLAAIPVSAADAPAWQTLYRNFLGLQTMNDVERAFLADLNMDGAPELIYLPDDSHIMTMTVGNGTLRVSGGLSFTQRMSGLTYGAKLYRLNRGGYVWRFELRHAGGTLLGELSLSTSGIDLRERFSSQNAADGSAEYFVNEKAVSKKAYDKRFAQYEATMTDTGVEAVYSQQGSPAYLQLDRMAGEWLSHPAAEIPAKSLTLNKVKATMLPERELQLIATRKPSYATGAVEFTSSDERLAVVDANGLVTVVGMEGRVTITAKLGALQKNCVITIERPALESIGLRGAIGVDVGAQTQLTVVVEPYGAPDDVTWTSSDESVARVSADGRVTGVSDGTAEITARSNAKKRISATYLMTVGQPDGAQTGSVTRRAVLVSHGMEYADDHENDGSVFEYDLLQLKNALSAATFGGEGRMSVRRVVNTKSGAQALHGIYQALKDADEDDVSYVFIQCHGGNPLEGAFSMLLGSMDDLVTAADLRATLDMVKGKIVVMLGCCYGGDAINKGVSRADMARATDRVIAAFRNAPRAKSGELCADKYQVLCAASQIQMSWYYYDSARDNWTGNSLFYRALCEGIGFDATVPAPTNTWLADGNGDGSVTLAESYAYVMPRVKELYYGDPGLYLNEEGELPTAGVQHVQVWPENSDFELFRK